MQDVYLLVSGPLAWGCLDYFCTWIDIQNLVDTEYREKERSGFAQLRLIPDME